MILQINKIILPPIYKANDLPFIEQTLLTAYFVVKSIILVNASLFVVCLVGFRVIMHSVSKFFLIR